jgi:hypothetical protein
MGISAVAALAARAQAGVPNAMMTATRRSTRSTANAGSWSTSLRAQRNSLVKSLPSTSPASPRPLQTAGDNIRASLGHALRQIADDGQRRLRVCRARPHCPRATDECDEVASSHGFPSVRGKHPITSSDERRCASQQIRQVIRSPRRQWRAVSAVP